MARKNTFIFWQLPPILPLVQLGVIGSLLQGSIDYESYCAFGMFGCDGRVLHPYDSGGGAHKLAQ
jgi:hypothetical protein